MELNAEDSFNHNHGDHMVEVFRIAAQTVTDEQAENLADALESAASRLEKYRQNGSAQLYSVGLRKVGNHLKQQDIQLQEIIAAIRSVSKEGNVHPEHSLESPPPRTGEVLKALLAGLAEWNQVAEGNSAGGNPLNFNAMFEFGMAYLQAQQRHQNRLDVLADAAASSSPLGQVPHRCHSGTVAIRALLQALQETEVPFSADQ